MGKLTVSLPDELHQRIRQELEERGITTAQFIEDAINTFFQRQKEDQSMKTRTLAFQVSEDLYQRIKEYLARYEQIYHRKLSQKEFVVGLIEDALEEQMQYDLQHDAAQPEEEGPAIGSTVDESEQEEIAEPEAPLLVTEDEADEAEDEAIEAPSI